MPWDIIVWETEDAVDYVPSSWGNSEKSAYKYSIKLSEQRIRALVYEGTDLNTNYKVCLARCLKVDVSNIKEAQELCEKARYTSNLESAEPLEENHQRTAGKRPSKKPKKLFEAENDFQEEVEDSSDDEPLSTQNRSRKFFSVPNSNSQLVSTVSSNSISTVKPSSAVVSTSNRSSTSFTAGTFHASSTSSNQTSCLVPSSPLTLGAFSRASYSASPNPAETKEIFKLLTDIKFEIKELKKKIDGDHYAHSINKVRFEETAESALITSLPCESLEDINKMEEMLKDPSKMKQLVHILYLVGGDSLQKTIYMIMAKLLGKEIALQYSAQGKKKKRPFCNLQNIFKAVTDATRRRHEDASDSEIKKIVGLFLATSKARLPPSKRNSSQEEPLNNEDF